MADDYGRLVTLNLLVRGTTIAYRVTVRGLLTTVVSKKTQKAVFLVTATTIKDTEVYLVIMSSSNGFHLRGRVTTPRRLRIPPTEKIASTTSTVINRIRFPACLS